MRQYIDTHGTGDADCADYLRRRAGDKYGEGSAELACQMYDALAEAANAGVPAAAAGGLPVPPGLPRWR